MTSLSEVTKILNNSVGTCVVGREVGMGGGASVNGMVEDNIGIGGSGGVRGVMERSNSSSGWGGGGVGGLLGAVKGGHHRHVKLLLEAGVPVNAADFSGTICILHSLMYPTPLLPLLDVSHSTLATP
ncbi:hypothetical protein Pcinc_015028 [Petrolisthes cinctipes]|uniref:Uncharacterized protein n=1 Tax=Petrolisthes cinctipes TaxID=88211 RepID=A0AAE1FVD6_PETCI|nr:hypothetical protein Pcinc_015028 [Petrolisthes cinctipes]